MDENPNYKKNTEEILRQPFLVGTYTLPPTDQPTN
jgi:hypothetical protein